MVQKIECHIEDERGNIVKKIDINFAQIYIKLWEIDPDKKKYTWLHTIDAYGYTIFNTLQASIILQELNAFLIEDLSDDIKVRLIKYIDFIKSLEDLEFLRFIGD